MPQPGSAGWLHPWATSRPPPAGRVLVQVVPAVQQARDVQAPVKGPNAVPLVRVRLGGSPPQGGGLACWRSDGVRRKGPVRAASVRHVRPLVRGVPTLSVLGVRRLPHGIRRACRVTRLLRLPVKRSPSLPRFRQSAVSGFPLPGRKRRRPAGHASPAQEPGGPPTFCGVSLPACRGLWTPADLHILATPEALVSPSACVKTLGVRHKLGSKRYQHFRVRGHPYGRQDARSTLRPACAPW